MSHPQELRLPTEGRRIPLLLDRHDRRVEVHLQCRQGNIDYRAVDEGDTRAENRRDENPDARTGGARIRPVTRPNQDFITWWLHELRGSYSGALRGEKRSWQVPNQSTAARHMDAFG